ncbi:MAG: tail completion protein gp17 [Janthinobacterium lividum]
MTVEETLVAALAGWPALATIAVYPGVAAEKRATPYIVYFQPSGSRVTDLQGDAGLANPQFQIDLYTNDLQQGTALKAEIRKALQAAPLLHAVFRNDGYTFEPDTKLHRHRQDFSFWFND